MTRFDLTCCHVKYCEQLLHAQYCLLEFYVETGGGILCKNCYLFTDIALVSSLTLLHSVFPHQIENASDVLITPLEKFRKEQIGAAKVRIL